MYLWCAACGPQAHTPRRVLVLNLDSSRRWIASRNASRNASLQPGSAGGSESHPARTRLLRVCRSSAASIPLILQPCKLRVQGSSPVAKRPAFWSTGLTRVRPQALLDRKGERLSCFFGVGCLKGLRVFRLTIPLPKCRVRSLLRVARLFRRLLASKT